MMKGRITSALIVAITTAAFAQTGAITQTIILKASNGRYVAVQGTADSVDVRASAMRPDSRTRLDLIATADSSIFLKAHSNGRYLTTTIDGDIVANGIDTNHAAKFIRHTNSNGTVSLQDITSSRFVTILPTPPPAPTVAPAPRAPIAGPNNQTVRPILPPSPAPGYTSEPAAVGKLKAAGTSIGETEQFTIENAPAAAPPTSLPAPLDSRVLAFLADNKGTKTVAGLHNKEPNSNPRLQTDRMFDITGKYSALWSGDFLFGQSDIDNRQTMINEAINQWNNGAIINIMWHAAPPTGGVSSGWDGGVVSHLSDDQWNDLLTEGGYLNGIWKERMDQVAGYLQQLEDAGVEVCFRPFHEMNQGVFWWGGRTGPNGTLKLFQFIHDYMENEKGLSNIVWVWDVQDFSFETHASYYPGDAYCDIAALDVYSNNGFPASNYQSMYDIIGDSKPIAIGETDKLPTSGKLTEQPNWCFFMSWAELSFSYNSDAELQALYGADNVITLDEMPGWGDPVVDTATNLALNKPVTASSTEAGNNVAENAVDGSRTTRWSSDYADSQNFIVDLEDYYFVNEVVINWEAAYGKSYQIQISSDNVSWTTVYENYNATGGTVRIPVDTVSARYVKMYGITRSGNYGFSMYEFAVHGQPDPDGSTALRPSSSIIRQQAVRMNTASGMMTVSTGSPSHSTISIHSANGRLLYSTETALTTHEINTRLLGISGMAIVSVVNADGRKAYKAILQ